MEKSLTRSSRNSVSKQVLFVAALLVFSALLIYVAAQYGNQNQFEYRESLEKVIFTLDGTEYRLGDLTYYIARQELRIEEQAEIYDAEDTNKFWAIHTNGTFFRLAGKKAALDMAVHDMLLCAEAGERGLELDGEEQSYADDAAADFSYELTQEQKDRTGLTDEKIYEMTQKAALAEKYQGILAKENDRNFGAFDYNGKAYEEMLGEHTLKIEEKLWDKVPFGNVALDHRFG